jgi:hypothetical protein
MPAPEHARESFPKLNPQSAADVTEILLERGWIGGEASEEQQAWCERAALLLGPQAADRATLENLLTLVFHYDAAKLVQQVESHAVLSRKAARDVLRETALLLLDGGGLDSERFKEIVAVLKQRLELRSRELFHPIRLALAGRVGEGELDRVILLIDGAAALQWDVPVKSTRRRMVEFCSALD